MRGYFSNINITTSFVSRVACTINLNYYYYHKFCFCSGGVRGYFLITTTIANCCFLRVVCAVIYYHCDFCFRVACTIIFHYYYHHEFCFVGWCAWLFLITIIGLRIVCFFGWRARLFLIILRSRVSVFGWCTRLFFNYYYCHEFCFPGGVRGYF